MISTAVLLILRTLNMQIADSHISQVMDFTRINGPRNLIFWINLAHVLHTFSDLRITAMCMHYSFLTAAALLVQQIWFPRSKKHLYVSTNFEGLKIWSISVWILWHIQAHTVRSTAFTWMNQDTLTCASTPCESLKLQSKVVITLWHIHTQFVKSEAAIGTCLDTLMCASTPCEGVKL